MKTQTEFFQANAVDGVLSDAQMAQMLNLREGDSSSMLQSSAPAAAPAAATPPVVDTPAASPAPVAGANPDQIPEGKTPVILAKDGFHTIGYEKLLEAREKVQATTAENERLRQELAAATAAPPAATAAPVPAADPVKAAIDAVDFGTFTDAEVKTGMLQAIKAGVEAMLPAKVAEALAPLERQRQTQAMTAHLTTMYTAFPDMDAILESTEYDGWKNTLPSYARAAVDAVIEGGTAEQVVEVLDSYAKATGRAPRTQPQGQAGTPPAADPLQQAQAAIDKAKKAPPASLSEIPGTPAAPNSPEAMLEMSPAAQINAFRGKSPEQIEALVKRAL